MSRYMQEAHRRALEPRSAMTRGLPAPGAAGQFIGFDAEGSAYLLRRIPDSCAFAIVGLDYDYGLTWDSDKECPIIRHIRVTDIPGYARPAPHDSTGGEA